MIYLYFKNIVKARFNYTQNPQNISADVGMLLIFIFALLNFNYAKGSSPSENNDSPLYTIYFGALITYKVLNILTQFGAVKIPLIDTLPLKFSQKIIIFLFYLHISLPFIFANLFFIFLGIVHALNWGTYLKFLLLFLSINHLEGWIGFVKNGILQKLPKKELVYMTIQLSIIAYLGYLSFLNLDLLDWSDAALCMVSCLLVIQAHKNSTYLAQTTSSFFTYQQRIRWPYLSILFNNKGISQNFIFSSVIMPLFFIFMIVYESQSGELKGHLDLGKVSYILLPIPIMFSVTLNNTWGNFPTYWINLKLSGKSTFQFLKHHFYLAIIPILLSLPYVIVLIYFSQQHWYFLVSQFIVLYLLSYIISFFFSSKMPLRINKDHGFNQRRNRIRPTIFTTLFALFYLKISTISLLFYVCSGMCLTLTIVLFYSIPSFLHGINEEKFYYKIMRN
jgi:hypothetical protein